MKKKKGVKELRAELKQATMEERKAVRDNITVNKDYSMGVPQKTEEKRLPPKEVPDVGTNPRKKKNMSENIPFY